MAGCAAGLTVFAVAPSKPQDGRDEPFQNRYFAHRGLYSRDGSVPENSLASFSAAVDAGYGIELDIQLTKDDEIVVFHDDRLDRMCGVKGRIDEFTLAQIKEMRLAHYNQSNGSTAAEQGAEHATDAKQGETIPTFEEVLAVVDGKVPLIVEFKGGPKNKTLCEKAIKVLRDYNRAHGGGEKGSRIFCVESFDPRIVLWFKHYAPDLYRGQLAHPVECYEKHLPWITRFCCAYCLFNFGTRPNFIAYGLGDRKKPWTVRLAELLGAKRVCWTSHNPSDKEGNDSVIFEFYKPPTKW